ncbi:MULTISPECIES: ammonium transporter [Fictibacillus]|uniref:Ammonium transporter n=1 Tax=Fictibacillus enclensis TaxID=1017270 RepID=A0A0V8JEB8_9BACL|nr:MULTISPECIES: ammonium transporter [Fictibacillus]KSU85381.1 ammonium transporter [Fictibacillus enclensis]RXY98954.1 ammonium transporter [Fictibacillus sp. S7]SCB95816.1 ammonium transporter, Amt family [Fictibacillus enclensis]
MTIQTLNTGIDTIWVVLTAAMIILMEGGFALLEAGFVRHKNNVNIIMKVFADITIGTLCFYLIGFGLMYGKDAFGLLGTNGFMIKGDLSHLDFLISTDTFWLFQAAFVIAVISIVSGAVAERINFRAYILYAILMTIFIYPVAGHWVWGGGWLGKLGMQDFAGSGVIHALGGFSALAAAMFIGPRKGKFTPQGMSTVSLPSNLPLASVGAFLLWFGWFGFNAGSTLSATDARIGHIAIVTMLSAASGGATAMLFTLFRYKRSDAPSVINGSLAGLVGITAGCAFVSDSFAILIGVVSGLVMLFATHWLEIKQIDDPVGAFPVHAASGIWGTIAVGLFATDNGLFTTGSWHLLGVQVLGLLVLCTWGFVLTWLGLKLIQLWIPVRSTEEEEEVGLDISYHGMVAAFQEQEFIKYESNYLHYKEED